jgi:hypothetical protein
VGAELGDEWLGGMVVHRGSRIYPIEDGSGVWAVPRHRLV